MNFWDLDFGNGKEEAGFKLFSYVILIIDNYTTVSKKTLISIQSWQVCMDVTLTQNGLNF